MGRSFCIITVLIGFLAGVGLYLVIQPAISILIGIIGFCVIGLLVARKINMVGTRHGASLPFIFIIAITCGLFRATLSEHHATPNQIDFYNGKKLSIEGVIVETDIRRDKAKYTIAVSKIETAPNSKLQIPNPKQITNPNNQNTKQHISGNILITFNKYPQYKYGDRVKIYGGLKTPGEFNGFSYSDYLSMQ